jgi:SAM-dependent methyltransferase
MKVSNIYGVPEDFCPTTSHEFYIIRRILIGIVSRFADSVDSCQVLDFGCGNSPYKVLFSHCNYVAVDFPSTGHSDSDKSADVYWDGTRLPFENDSFDTILMTEVLEHLFDPYVVMAELNRVLRPGGKLLLTTPFIWELHESPYDYARYTTFGIRFLAEQSGFVVTNAVKHGANLDALIQVAICSRFLSGRRYTNKVNRMLIRVLNSISNVARLHSTINPMADDSGFYLTNEFVLTKVLSSAG